MAHISVLAELSFPEVQPLTFMGRDVALPGAVPGDVVQLTEPYQRPAGVAFFAFVRDLGIVSICAKNKTGGTITVPRAAYGLLITK